MVVPIAPPGQQVCVGAHAGSQTGPPPPQYGGGSTHSHVSGTHLVMHSLCGAAPELGPPFGAVPPDPGTLPEAGEPPAEGSPPEPGAAPDAAEGSWPLACSAAASAAAWALGPGSISPKVQIFSPGGQVKGSH